MVPMKNSEVMSEKLNVMVICASGNWVQHSVLDYTKLKRCTLWSTLTFQECSSRHITGVDVSTATNWMKNVTVVSKATMVY